jgi:hypothetical protein
VRIKFRFTLSSGRIQRMRKAIAIALVAAAAVAIIYVAFAQQAVG